ncbi:D-Ala-D-Ala carboxypeptidase family metallohydrolase [Ruminococcus sp.]|uniref:D-Ala-D-Ala carboxypeptidase family metallohydrolase n=1 Tax=Ruminococcus sp. TaxID=41978 RepID=UPI0025D5DD17|nr:D-Ala-D-Ala carboxypeptidase family metallohydrolase [Ruminococcus sp.]MCI5816635.1 D-Ala-D-Ala carboxypeptidase family metallohydrolase [Ruminococcus sp.]
MRVDTTLIGYLEQIYAYLNCSKIIVSSGYRCPSHDKAVGGSGAGRHTMGMAADICYYDQDGQPIESNHVACAAEDLGINGIGLNCGGKSTYTHIDSRSASAKW